MSTLSRLRRGLRNPRLFLREANRLYHRRLNTRSYNTDGVDVFSEDWDNLIILDACRYDMFEEFCEIDGQLESRQSRGSSTVEFLKANLTGRQLHDTVYVTANPKVHEHRATLNVEFHDIVHVWQEGWDESRQSVLPETMTDFALDAADKDSDKRLLIHYIQPHYPFIGTESNPFTDEDAFMKPNEPGSWHRRFTGELSPTSEEVWEAYTSTLECTLPEVSRLLEGLRGKSVITADHGNMVGERASPIPVREWGHPTGIYMKHLVRVPWFIQDTGNRRHIVSEEPSQHTESADAEVVNDRLRQLGYVT
jgi:hypothetical protein